MPMPSYPVVENLSCCYLWITADLLLKESALGLRCPLPEVCISVYSGGLPAVTSGSPNP